jgi:hypothetical protein
MKYVIVTAFALILGSFGGFFGGMVATRNAQTVSARQFVVLDQRGMPRALLAVVPQRAAIPTCDICDGRAHLITADERMMWPPPEAQPSPEDVSKILRFLLR